MPGPTNPWASELKKTRQRGGGNKPLLKGKEQKSSSLQHPDDAIKHQDETSRDEKSQDEKSLHETREAVITTTTNTMEKAAVDEVKKYVKVQDDDVAAAEVVGGTSKKKDSSPPRWRQGCRPWCTACTASIPPSHYNKFKFELIK